VQTIEAHFSKLEQLEMVSAFVKNFSSAVMPFNLRYTLLGTNTDERFQFLSMLKKVRPSEEFTELLGTVVKSTLNEAAYEAMVGRLRK